MRHFKSMFESMGHFTTGHCRAFIFSLDAFVAFSLAIIVIYSLIFFSSVPGAYYSSFMQAHYLAKDALIALSETKITGIPELEGMSKLEYVVGSGPSSRAADVRQIIGPLIPDQFGYALEVKEWSGGVWEVYYDSKDGGADETHKKTYGKLKASAEIVAFGYKTKSPPQSPYSYITCGGDYDACNPPEVEGEEYEPKVGIVRLTVYK